MGPDPDLIVVFSFLTSMVIGLPIAIAIARRISAKPPQQQRLTEDLEAKLQRIEQMTEATQIEVERLAEGQRFTARLLAERQPVREPRSEP